MKILYFYRFCKDYNFDSFFLLDKIRWEKNNGYDVKCYGLDIHTGYPDICLTPYNPNITMEDLHKLYPFDAVISMTKSRCFDYYSPAKYPYKKEERRGCWLPKDFSSFNTKKIMCEQDFHYEVSCEWYEEMNFSLLINHHYANDIRARTMTSIPTKWLPFSVDTDVFYPDGPRVNKICFMGNNTHEIYIYRKGAVDRLVKTMPESIDNYECSIKGPKYPQYLRKYVGAISCGSIYDITPGKTWEILASGTVLLTNNGNYGMADLFPNDSYVTYENDFSDVEEKARKILTDKDFVVYTTDLALKTVRERHTHRVRTEELIKIIEEIK